MTRHDWPILWANHAPAEIVTRMIGMALRTGASYAYVHGDHLLLSETEIADFSDDLTAVAEPGTSHRLIRDKLIEGFDAARGDR